MIPCLMMRTMENGQTIGRTVEFEAEDAPKVGEARKLEDGRLWSRMPDPDADRPFQAPVVRMMRPTVAHSMPRRGDPRDPGAPRYDGRGRPVMETTEEKLSYAKAYEQHNHEPCRFEQTSSVGAFDDED